MRPFIYVTLLLLILAGAFVPRHANASKFTQDGEVEASYFSPKGGRMHIIKGSACRLFGEVIPETKQLRVISPSGAVMNGCIGVIQGTVVGLFETDAPGQVRVVVLEGYTFVPAEGV